MKKLVLITSLLTITAITPLAQAASGTINFTGQITAATCDIKGAAGTTITIPLGTISIDDIKEVGANSRVATGGTTIEIECKGATGFSTVAMNFDPAAGSGFASNNLDLLALTPATGAGNNTATNVGIGLLDLDNKLIKLGSGQTLDTTLTPTTGATAGDATAKIQVRAAYFKTTAAAPTPGEANGTMAFTMSYK